MADAACPWPATYDPAGYTRPIVCPGDGAYIRVTPRAILTNGQTLELVCVGAAGESGPMVLKFVPEPAGGLLAGLVLLALLARRRGRRRARR